MTTEQVTTLIGVITAAIGSITAAIVTVINAWKSMQAAQKVDQKADVVIKRLGDQDHMLMTAADKLSEYHGTVTGALEEQARGTAQAQIDVLKQELAVAQSKIAIAEKQKP